MSFFSDSDQTVTVRWYFCDQGAPTLPFPTAFNSAIWDSGPDISPSLGESGPRTWCDGSPPPWGDISLIAWEPPANYFGPIFVTVTNVNTPYSPPYGQVGKVIQCDYNAQSDSWLGPPMLQGGIGPNYLQIEILYTIWRCNFVFGDQQADGQIRGIAMPWVLFPGPAPLGAQSYWTDGAPLGPGLGANPLGFCATAGNYGGKGLEIWLGVDQGMNNEHWTAQITTVDPGIPARLFPSSDYWDLAGDYVWRSPIGCERARIELQGAGAGGGMQSQNLWMGGAGGGAGGWGVWDSVTIQPDTPYAVHVGAGGLGGAGYLVSGAGQTGIAGGFTWWGARTFVALCGVGGDGGTQTGSYCSGGVGQGVNPPATWSRVGKAGGFGAPVRGAGSGGNSHFAKGGSGGIPSGEDGGIPGAGGSGSADPTKSGGMGGIGWARVIYAGGYVRPAPTDIGGFFPPGFYPDGFFAPGFFP